MYEAEAEKVLAAYGPNMPDPGVSAHAEAE
jgi:hypothetical protein